ncbi:type II toxin-antitoxin system RelE/ParE family toxin [Sphingobacterium siyangense]|uniref:type II toxin-antitoxin system RelE/ParE family toxin n=1 Tax=Sphingobacterium siyangense TaxID=459529 RepID=UPI003C762687
MKITYSNKIKKKFSSAVEIKKAFGMMAKKVQSRLDDIEASPNLNVLLQIPSANCHSLSGNRDGEWAVNISPNHRLIFEIDNDPIPLTPTGEIDRIRVTDIRIIDTTDYH